MATSGFWKTNSDDILPITYLAKFGCYEFSFKCPHCGEVRYIENETGSLSDLIGEQYKDNWCGGVFELSSDAILVSSVELADNQLSQREKELTAEKGEE